MTAQGWLQIAIFFAILTALTPVAGGYMARVYTGERVVLARVLGPLERLLYRLVRTDPDREQDWRSYGRTVDRLRPRLVAGAVPHPAHAGDPSVQPGGLPLGDVGRLVQHGLVVRHEHELAVLRRRDDAVVLLADGRPGRPELPLGRGRHGRARRGDPRLRPAQHDLTGQLLAGPDPVAALHPAADQRRRRARARLAGRHPDALAVPRLPDAHGWGVEPRARPGRLAGGHQGARDERRRLLQRQLGDAVREPQRDHEPARDAAHAHHPGGPDGHVRADGGQPPPGLGPVRGDVRAVRRRRGDRLRRRGPRLGRPARRRHHGRQPRGQGGALRRDQLVAVGGDHHGDLDAARSTPRWTR